MFIAQLMLSPLQPLLIHYQDIPIGIVYSAINAFSPLQPENGPIHTALEGRSTDPRPYFVKGPLTPSGTLEKALSITTLMYICEAGQ